MHSQYSQKCNLKYIGFVYLHLKNRYLNLSKPNCLTNRETIFLSIVISDHLEKYLHIFWIKIGFTEFFKCQTFDPISHVSVYIVFTKICKQFHRALVSVDILEQLGVTCLVQHTETSVYHTQKRMSLTRNRKKPSN